MATGKFLAPAAGDMLENYMVKTGGILPATVWHGSPHKFDAFDASKIGTGEGAQAYGHGLYLAESKGVAGSYKDKLSPDTITRVKNDVYNIAGDDNHILTIYDANGKATKTPYLSPDELDKWVGKDTADMLRAKGDGDYKGLNVDFGNLYKVDLPDEHIANMLDWDKPLNQQTPEVRELLRKHGISGKSWDVQALGDGPQGYLNDRFIYDNAFDARKQINELRSQGYYARPYGDAMGKNKTGAEFVRDLNDPAQQSERLRQMGIPGIRYLDGDSRGAGQGSSNFVVFPGNEGLLNILERNGQPVNGLLGQ
jgi:hypothetical protein